MLIHNIFQCNPFCFCLLQTSTCHIYSSNKRVENTDSEICTFFTEVNAAHEMMLITQSCFWTIQGTRLNQEFIRFWHINSRLHQPESDVTNMFNEGCVATHFHSANYQYVENEKWVIRMLSLFCPFTQFETTCSLHARFVPISSCENVFPQYCCSALDGLRTAPQITLREGMTQGCTNKLECVPVSQIF